MIILGTCRHVCINNNIFLKERVFYLVQLKRKCLYQKKLLSLNTQDYLNVDIYTSWFRTSQTLPKKACFTIPCWDEVRTTKFSLPLNLNFSLPYSQVKGSYQCKWKLWGTNLRHRSDELFLTPFLSEIVNLWGVRIYTILTTGQSTQLRLRYHAR